MKKFIYPWQKIGKFHENDVYSSNAMSWCSLMFSVNTY